MSVRTKSPPPNHFRDLQRGIQKAAARTKPKDDAVAAYQAQKPGHEALADQFRRQGEEAGYARAKREADAARDIIARRTYEELACLRPVTITPPPIPWLKRLYRYWQLQIELGLSAAFVAVFLVVVVREVWGLSPLVWKLTGEAFRSAVVIATNA